MTQRISLQSWSTDVESPGRRLDFYAGLLSSLQAPVQLSVAERERFEARVIAADLGSVSIVHQKGTPLRCREDRRNQGRAESRSFHLLLSLTTSWDAEHAGTHHCEPGDAMLFDAALPWRISHALPYEVINIKMSEAWLRQWVPSPSVLVGRPIRGADGWGRALVGFASQLLPEFFEHAPLPHSTLIDQLGALLALSASRLSGDATATPHRAESSVATRIAECVEQRCFEHGLTAEQVAQSLGISVRTLHRCLAHQQRAFGSLLVAARSRAAVRMLSSPLFRRLTIAEIGRRAGFTHASHFTRTLRAHTGCTPSELRRDLGVTTVDPDGPRGPVLVDRRDLPFRRLVPA